MAKGGQEKRSYGSTGYLYSELLERNDGVGDLPERGYHIVIDINPIY